MIRPYTFKDDDFKQNVSLFSSIELGNLEYRDYDSVMENEVHVFLAEVDDRNVGHLTNCRGTRTCSYWRLGMYLIGILPRS